MVTGAAGFIGSTLCERLVAMGRNLAVVIVDQSGKELAVQKIPYGARLLVDEGDDVKRGTRRKPAKK